MSQRQLPAGEVHHPANYTAVAAKEKVRVITWIIPAINVLFLVWMIFGAASASGAKCAGLTEQNCAAAEAIGGGIGAIFIIFLWVTADMILGISYLVTRRKEPTVVYIQ